MNRRLLGLTTALATLIAGAAAAQTIAITNARLVTMGPAGEIASGTVVMQNGKITAVGAGVRAPAGAQVIDAGGRIVTPGLMSPESNLGLVEVGQVPASVDRANTNSRLSAGFDVQYGLNPATPLIPVARRAGITRAVVNPLFAGGANREYLFAGQSAVIDLGADDDMLTKAKVGMVIGFGEDGAERSGGARGGEIVLVKAVFDEVRAYMRGRGAYEAGATREFELSKADLEALIPVVTGRMPMVAQAHRASDIRQVLKLAREENVKVIIEGGDEAWIVAGDLARAGVPVVLDALQDLPNSFEQVNATLENAGRLEKAGVMVAIKGSNGGTFRVRELRYNAGNAVANGMSWSGGLAAITINPAKIFGVADRVGSLEVGKDADVVVWSGDPLEPMSDALQVFIQGREQPLRSRMEELAERYRYLKRATPPAYH